MGMLKRIMDALRPQPQNSAFEEAFWRDQLVTLGVQTKAGEHVTWESAMRLTTALRCGLVLSDGVATVPCKIMRKNADGTRKHATDHPLHSLFSRAPNDWMDSLQLRETMMMHAVFTGNAYCFINRVRGRITELIPLIPSRVRIEQKSDLSIVYHVSGLDGAVKEFPAEAIWHVRGPSWNSYSGLDVTKQAAEALGLAAATQNAHAKRFANGVHTSGVLSRTGTLDEAQYKKLAAFVAREMVGARNSGKPLIMDGDAKWTPMELTGVDAQHIETRKLQIEEVCRGFGVNPIMVYHFDRNATYASSEQMFLQHQVHTVRPWHRRFEFSMHRSLLTKAEFEAGYYFKFLDTEMLRGAAKDRAEYYWKRFQMGMSPNKIAELEDEDGFEGGDAHFIPANMATVQNVIDGLTKGTGGQQDGSNRTGFPGFGAAAE